MDDSFDKGVSRLRKSKTKEEIQRGLANSEVGKLVYQHHPAALQQIQAEEAVSMETRVEERHREAIFEDRFTRKIAFLALLLAAFALGMEVWDRFGPEEPKTEARASLPSHRTTISEGQRSNTIE